MFQSALNGNGYICCVIAVNNNATCRLLENARAHSPE